MKLIKTAIVSVILFLGTSFTCTQPVRAQIVSDPALLVQQILQFFQDVENNIKQIEKAGKDLQRLEEVMNTVQDIAGVITEAGKVVSAVSETVSFINRIADAYKYIERTERQLMSFIKFLESTSDNFKINKAGYYLSSFTSRAGALIRSVESLINYISRIPDMAPSDLLHWLEDLSDDLVSEISSESDEALYQVASICVMQEIEHNIEMNNRTRNALII